MTLEVGHICSRIAPLRCGCLSVHGFLTGPVYWGE